MVNSDEFDEIVEKWNNCWYPSSELAEKLIDIAKGHLDDEKQYTAARMLFQSSYPRCREIGKDLLVQICQSQHHRHSLPAAQILFNDSSKDISQIGESRLAEACGQEYDTPQAFFAVCATYKLPNDPFDPLIYSKALNLWGTWFGANYRDAAILLVNISRTPNHPNSFDATRKLWKSRLSEYYSLAIPGLILIGKNHESSHCYEAINLLWTSQYQKYYDLAVPLLVQLGENVNHEKCYDAILCLTESSYNNYRLQARQPLRNLCTLKTHIHSFDATELLWKSFERDSVARDHLIEIVELGGISHPNSKRSAKLLWEGTIQDMEIARNLFYLIIDDHLMNSVGNLSVEKLLEEYDILKLLIESPNGQDREKSRPWLYSLVNLLHQKMLTINILTLCTNPEVRSLTIDEKNFIEIVKCLWSSHEKVQDRSFLKPILLEMVRTSVSQLATNQITIYSSKFLLELYQLLWSSDISKESPTFRAAFIAIIGPGNHMTVQDRLLLLHLLRESNNPEDQNVAIQLLLQYFPQEIKLQNHVNIIKSMYNWEKIRSVMPKPLEDLSSKNIDIYSKLIGFFDLSISHRKDPKSPYYLSLEAITGESHNTSGYSDSDMEREYNNIKEHMGNYLCELLGLPKPQQSFWEWSTSTSPPKTTYSVWKMHPEYIPDMINSLKHLVIYIDEHLSDPSNIEKIHRAMIAIGIVFNAILYCPTGQAEGIDSAINLLIRQQHHTTQDLTYIIGTKIIQSALIKSFYNAFHKNGGGVHALSRARVVLAEEIGLTHAIQSFEEQISAVSIHEVPSIYESFFKYFNLDMIILEFRRNIPTIVEGYIIEESNWKKALKEKAQSIKVNKPIMLGSLVSWLVDQGVSEEDILDIENGYGFSEDYKQITDRGLLRVLIKMGYLTEVASPIVNSYPLNLAKEQKKLEDESKDIYT